MKKLTLPLAAAVLAVTTAGTMAADLGAATAYKAPPRVEVPQHVTGYIEIFGGWAKVAERESYCEVSGDETFCGSNSDRIDGWVLGGAGRGNYWFAPNMTVQFDAQGEGTSYKVYSGGGRDIHISSHSYLVGSHLSWRDSERGLLGVFAGAGDVNGTRHVVAGGQGQFYWNNFTLYGQAGYNVALHLPFDMDAWFGRLTGRYFVTPNFLIEATGLFAKGELRFGNEFMGPDSISSLGFETWGWEAKAEWRMPNHPFAFFFKYAGSQTKYDRVNYVEEPGVIYGYYDVKVTDHRFLGGIKLAIGDRTLMAQDRKGATLDIIAPLGLPSGPAGAGAFSFAGPI